MKAENSIRNFRQGSVLKLAVLLGGAVVAVGGLMAIALGGVLVSPLVLATGVILVGLGVLVSLLAAPNFRNKIAIEIAGVLLTIVAVTLLFAGLKTPVPSVGILDTALLVLVYVVLGGVLADRILLVPRKRSFSTTSAGFRPPLVPLRRFLLRGNVVRYDEVARFLVRYEGGGKKVGYAILRDGTLIMLRQAEGVPTEFLDRLASLVGKVD